MDRRNIFGRGGSKNTPQQGGRGGRGRGRTDSKPYKPPHKQEEIKFSPYGGGSGKIPATFVTVKNSIIGTIQKTFKHGQDMVDTIRNMEKIDLTRFQPTMIPAEETVGETDAQFRSKQKALEVKFQIDYTTFCKRIQA